MPHSLAMLARAMSLLVMLVSDGGGGGLLKGCVGMGRVLK